MEAHLSSSFRRLPYALISPDTAAFGPIIDDIDDRQGIGGRLWQKERGEQPSIRHACPRAPSMLSNVNLSAHFDEAIEILTIFRVL